MERNKEATEWTHVSRGSDAKGCHEDIFILGLRLVKSSYWKIY